MAKTTPLVQGNTLTYQHEEQEQVLLVETPAWYAWLETASSFAFTSEVGTFTARKERAGNQRGGWYWKAYHKQHGQLASHYLGKSETLTLARLLDVAQTLSAVRVETTTEPEAEVAVPSAPAAAPGMRNVAPPPLLTTKLYRPLPRAHLVRRPQLFARLTQGVERPLTLVSAPAGFGKTTLLAQWLAESDTPAAWLSLDAGENDPIRFLAYLVAAVQTFAPHLGARLLVILQSSQPPPPEALLTALLNDLTTLPGHVILVLDDYHLLDTHPVDQMLSFLLEHLPPQLHLVIATREDPHLPLARLRARGQLTELRAADLRFTPSEAAAFLNDVMGLHLSTDNIAALEQRTEGWIAGLHLAALALQGQPDSADFIRSFTGSHQFVLDYLVEEVLQQLPEGVQAFLLCTSILDRLCGSLCDAVVRDPSASGQATLEALARANLFLVPLDHERHWYRYHHLFAELLRKLLHSTTVSSMSEERTPIAELHRRASLWYEENGLDLEAFHHAVAAQDLDRAARLVEGGGMSLPFLGAVAPVLSWLESLSPTDLDARPSLWVVYASALLFVGQTSAVEEKLQAAEAALEGTEPDEGTQDLVGRIASMRATLAVMQHDGDTILTQSRRALEYLHPNNLPLRMGATWTLGYAYQLQGDRAAASRAYTDIIARGKSFGDSIYTLAATISLGQVQETNNQLSLAAESYQRALHLAGDPPLLIACEAHLGLARILYQWNDLEAAWQHGQHCVQLTRQIDSIDTFVSAAVLLSYLKMALGEVPSASAILEEAKAYARQHHFVYRMSEVAAAQVLLLLHQGKLAAAAELAEMHQLPLSQARVYLAQGDPLAALKVLESWRQQVEAKGWEDERLRVLVLEALTLQAQGEQDQASHRLVDALALAEPGGFIRLFVDEGAPMAQLLAVAGASGRGSDYLGKLLAAGEANEVQREDPVSQPPAQPLIELLSPREQEVLQLIAQGHSDQEISERLVLALSTVKGHNRNIFDKLQVHRRTEAVARARALGLL